MDKKVIYLSIGIIIVILILALINSFNNNNPPPAQDDNTLKTFFIDKDGPIPAANIEAGGIKNKVIIIESKYCSACKDFLKVLDKVGQDTNYIFHKYDVSENDQRSYIKDTLKLDFQYTPTTIIGGDAYIGYLDENKLLDILSKYKLEQK